MSNDRVIQDPLPGFDLLSLIDRRQIYSARQVAYFLGCDAKTVTAAIRRGDLPAYRVGPRKWFIKGTDVLAFIGRDSEC